MKANCVSGSSGAGGEGFYDREPRPQSTGVTKFVLSILECDFPENSGMTNRFSDSLLASLR